jgi:formylglycine-generating enzyme required for sulfatase activity
MATTVFISYSHHDATIVATVIAALQRQHISVWIDHENLTPGTNDWEDAIRRGIQQASHVIYLASPEARQSVFVKDELGFAKSYQKPIIPVLIAGHDSYDAIPLGYNMIQHIDGRGTALAAAITTLIARITGTPSAPVTPPPPAYTEIAIPVSLHTKGFQGRRINGVEVIIPPLVTVPAGTFIMGSDKQKDSQANDDETPQYAVPLGNFAISTYPLTVAEYACFVRATKRTAPPDVTFSDSQYVAAAWRKKTLTWTIQQNERSDHPVVCISWQDALAYAQWLAQVTGEPYRLPSEAEWERAARGTDGHIYPWGNQWDKTRANTNDGGPGMTTSIGSYPQGVSPVGALDMSGNVWEWTNTLYKPYPYSATDGREDVRTAGNRVLRGGSWFYVPRDARAAFRGIFDPSFINLIFGARLVRVGAG